MLRCFFVSDLHGHVDRYDKLFAAIRAERPAAVFLGGDLLPHMMSSTGSAGAAHPDFVNDFLATGFLKLRSALGAARPRVFLILGNDDPRFEEGAILDAETRGAWEYAHGRRIDWGAHAVIGYACVPPTPFRLKDWERYDVSRFVDPGCYPPEEGWHTVPVDARELRLGTIRDDLARLASDASLDRAVLLLHTPPYKTLLDRAALDGKSVDHAPLDVHVGSVAVRQLIEDRQPLVALCGHVHESARLTGFWRDKIGRTHVFSAAHDGPELALVRFDLEHPESASREMA